MNNTYRVANKVASLSKEELKYVLEKMGYLVHEEDSSSVLAALVLDKWERGIISDVTIEEFIKEKENKN